MSGDIVTTIKECVWILAPISLIVALLNAFVPAWARRGIGWTFVLTRTRKLKRLQKRRARLQLLKKCNREYYGWLLSIVVWGLAMLALALAAGSLIGPLNPLSVDAINALRYIIAMFAYFVTISCYSDYKALQHFDRTMEGLDRDIAKLETKISLQPAASAI